MTSQSGSTRSSTEDAWASFESEFGKGWIRWGDAGVPNHIALPGSGEPPSLRGYAGGPALKRRLLELEEGNATE